MLRAIEALVDEPRPPGAKKYRSEQRDIYRIRAGNYRAVYVIEDERLLILVIRVGHRSDVYRRR